MKCWPMTMTGLAGLAVVACATPEASSAPEGARPMDPAIDGDWSRLKGDERVSLDELERVFDRAVTQGDGANGAPQVLAALSCVGGPFDTRYMIGARDGSTTTLVVAVEDLSSAGLPPCSDEGWTRMILGRLTPAGRPDAQPILKVFRSRELAPDDAPGFVDFIR